MKYYCDQMVRHFCIMIELNSYVIVCYRVPAALGLDVLKIAVLMCLCPFVFVNVSLSNHGDLYRHCP